MRQFPLGGRSTDILGQTMGMKLSKRGTEDRSTLHSPSILRMLRMYWCCQHLQYSQYHRTQYCQYLQHPHYRTLIYLRYAEYLFTVSITHILRVQVHESLLERKLRISLPGTGSICAKYSSRPGRGSCPPPLPLDCTAVIPLCSVGTQIGSAIPTRGEFVRTLGWFVPARGMV